MGYLKQPLIVAFIIVGIVVGPSGLGLVHSMEEIELLSELGIAILLFVVGLKLDIHLVKTTGPVALITGLGQVVFTSIIGYLIALSLGFSHITSAYIAVALTFSSTIIIVKLLSDRNEIEHLHGQIAMGFLIVQDIVVVLVMIIITALGDPEEGTSFSYQLASVYMKGVFFILIIWILMKYVLPQLVHHLARSKELLLLFAISWAVVLAALSDLLDFSKEVGAFLGGFSLAPTPFRETISGRLESIRDFLLLFFFINLGAHLDLGLIGNNIEYALIFSAFVLIGNPLIVMIIMGLMGYRKQTSFLAGLTVAQISEFSLILAALGFQMGHIDESTIGLITLVGLITIGMSTYLIIYSGWLYEKLAPILKIFEKSKHKETEISKNYEDVDYILIGLGRFGRFLFLEMVDRGFKVLGVDYNPDLVEEMKSAGYKVFYGDGEDHALPQLLPIDKGPMIISTLPSLNSNLKLIQFLKENNFKGKLSVIAYSDLHYEVLKSEGIDWIIRPQIPATKDFISRLEKC